MRWRFGDRTANWLCGGAHGLILYGAFQFESRVAWMIALLLMIGVAFAAWVGNYRRLSQIATTPLSNIATAAQGYVEIAGRATAPDGATIRARLSNTPCVWYQFEIRYLRDDNRNLDADEMGASDAPFVITDATGTCVIDPADAEVRTSRENSWTRGDYRYTEWLLLPKDTVYALGDFVTVGGVHTPLDLNGDVGDLLAQWKTNRPALLKRFDLNQDGEIDLAEWGLARRQIGRAHV
mgnify:CR=1 FL=1